MAKLISEDKDIQSFFEINFLQSDIEKKEKLSWIPYEVSVSSGEQSLLFKAKKDNPGAGDYVFALSPINELENLIESLTSFISNDKNKYFSFEPLEPSFELTIERSHKGFSVHAWVDSGNVISDHYTWDALGLRFFSTEESIHSFIDELKQYKIT